MDNRILLVEDDISISNLIRDYLEIDGFSVVQTENGNRGLELALQESFNLILLDVMLPGINGFDICREIRKQSDIPVLLIFARKEDIDKIFDRIWGEDTLGDTTTVTVHVRKIREKIEEHPSEPEYLETVWGMGYRLRI